MECKITAVGEGAEKQKQCSSYRYWVRNRSEDAAPLPVPRKLTPQEQEQEQDIQPSSLGSVWNKAGTWEEKNLNSWATARIKAFLVTVRNKKRVGYTYELTLKFKGEWLIQEEKKKINGHIDIPEFSFGELDDLQVDVRLSDEKDLVQQFKAQIKQDMNVFLHPIRERLLQFEQELKER